MLGLAVLKGSIDPFSVVLIALWYTILVGTYTAFTPSIAFTSIPV
jgi:hypothetical protein